MSDRDSKVIGWFAMRGTDVVCDGDGCVIAGSERAMQRMAARSGQPITAYTIKKTRFGEIMTGLRLGAAYCFDQEAYDRFLPLGKQEGLDLKPEDLSETGSTGFHFLKVQIGTRR